MKPKKLLALLLLYFIIGCNQTDNKSAEKNASSDSVNVTNKNVLTATINAIKAEDNAPLIIFKKKTDTSKESISISGVFNEANSHIGLLIVSDTGILSPGKYQLQQKNEKLTNGRYETNINGGATAPENTLFKATGTVNIISIDTIAKKIVADFEMDAVNKAKEKVHITGHVKSVYK
jgi:hypothetical protein